MNIEDSVEIKYPNYGVEITLDNEETLIFSLFYTPKYGTCLLLEDIPYGECVTPDELMANIKEEERLRELVILEDGISTLDVKGQRKNLPVMVKEINIFDNDKNNDFKIAGSLVKYSTKMASKYELDEELAYDYVKPVYTRPNTRRRKHK